MLMELLSGQGLFRDEMPLLSLDLGHHGEADISALNIKYKKTFN